MTVYLDCNATTPMEPAVATAVMEAMLEEYGNAGSRTHEHGQRAKAAVQKAREQVAAVVGATRDDVIFTSGATESDNLALLGLIEHGLKSGRRHVLSTAMEHKAVLEPLALMAQRGFEVELIPPDAHGQVAVEALVSRLRPDTLLVSMMHVNNETGVIQPVEELATAMVGHEAWLHVDAAQSFGKLIAPLRQPRIDMISVSGHKIFGPKGVGALILRRRGYARAPLKPLMAGGGQERGLRPGTLPVPLIVGLGLAAELAERDHSTRERACQTFGRALLDGLGPQEPVINGGGAERLSNAVNLRFPGLDSEAVMMALKGVVAISNGSACTSSSYTPSHVLLAMGQTEVEAQEALRWSWCHMTPEVDWREVCRLIERLR